MTKLHRPIAGALGALLVAWGAAPALADDSASNGIDWDRRGDRIEARLDRRGDHIDHRLDLRGDRIETRFDARADRALAHGHPARARALDRRGNRIDRRLDRRDRRSAGR